MKNIEDFFKLGMKRDTGTLRDTTGEGNTINVGAGNVVIAGATNFDYPEWDGERQRLPFPDGSIQVIHAYHFLEHLSSPIFFLVSAQQALAKGGVLNICVPYYTSNLYSSDLDHQHPFTENTFKNLFNKKYSDKHNIEWEFKINMSLIIGIEERCLALLVQLERI